MTESQSHEGMTAHYQLGVQERMTKFHESVADCMSLSVVEIKAGESFKTISSSLEVISGIGPRV